MSFGGCQGGQHSAEWSSRETTQTTTSASLLWVLSSNNISDNIYLFVVYSVGQTVPRRLSKLVSNRGRGPSRGSRRRRRPNGSHRRPPCPPPQFVGARRPPSESIEINWVINHNSKHTEKRWKWEKKINMRLACLRQSCYLTKSHNPWRIVWGKININKSILSKRSIKSISYTGGGGGRRFIIRGIAFSSMRAKKVRKNKLVIYLNHFFSATACAFN